VSNQIDQTAASTLHRLWIGLSLPIPAPSLERRLVAAIAREHVPNQDTTTAALRATFLVNFALVGID
jgi:hypothetical protein